MDQRTAVMNLFEEQGGFQPATPPRGESPPRRDEAGVTDLDQVLGDLGYTKLDVITTQVGDREKVAYIKAFNSEGNIVFVLADRPGSLSIDGRIVVQAADSSTIGASLRVRSEQCASASGCGVLLQCDRSFCVLRRDDMGKVHEENLASSSASSESSVRGIFPVVTLSEILTDNKDATLRVRQATEAIQRSSLESSLRGIQQLESSARDLLIHLDVYRRYYQELQQQRLIEIKAARQVASQYEALQQRGPLSQEDIVKKQQIINKLWQLNKMSLQLSGGAADLARYQEKVDSLVLGVKDAFFQLFVEAKEHLDPEVSRKTLDAAHWGLPPEINRLASLRAEVGSLSVPSTPEMRSLRRVLGV